MGSPPGGRPGTPPSERTPFLTGARVRALIGLKIGIVVVVLVLVAWFAWNNIAWVDTLHARIDGTLVQVRAPTMGRVVALPLEVGDAVAQYEELGTLELVGTTGSGRVLLPIKAPIAGLVTEKTVKEGDIVSAGQVIVTLVDTSELWVTANIHESRIPQVRVGQRAHIWINTRTVRRDFWGRVEQVGRAANTALASARGVTSAAASPVEVPVKISIDPAGYELYPGMTAEVWIRLSPRLW